MDEKIETENETAAETQTETTKETKTLVLTNTATEEEETLLETENVREKRKIGTERRKTLSQERGSNLEGRKVANLNEENRKGQSNKGNISEIGKQLIRTKVDKGNSENKPKMVIQAPVKAKATKDSKNKGISHKLIKTPKPSKNNQNQPKQTKNRNNFSQTKLKNQETQQNINPKATKNIQNSKPHNENLRSKCKTEDVKNKPEIGNKANKKNKLSNVINTLKKIEKIVVNKEIGIIETPNLKIEQTDSQLPNNVANDPESTELDPKPARKRKRKRKRRKKKKKKKNKEQEKKNLETEETNKEPQIKDQNSKIKQQANISVPNNTESDFFSKMMDRKSKKIAENFTSKLNRKGKALSSKMPNFSLLMELAKNSALEIQTSCEGCGKKDNPKVSQIIVNKQIF